MSHKKALLRLGLGGFVVAAAMATTPAVAAADPITDFLCSSGSAQFCPILPPPPPALLPPPPPPPAFEYRNCTEARDAGDAPVYRGDYGFGPHLDRDNDGIGCE